VRVPRILILALFCLALAGPKETEIAAGETGQKGSLRITLDGSISPRKLSRQGDTPISVSVGWKIATVDGSTPATLKGVRIEINRNGHFDYAGLPNCSYAKIQPATTARALASCRSALVGRGRFGALVAVEGQEPYVAKGQILLFKGQQHGKTVLLGQIYSPFPFANSFVIVFQLQRLGRGRFGTALAATMPPALRGWGTLVEVEMRLSRRFSDRHGRHSFLSASCPAPAGFGGAVFPLARASFDFVGAKPQTLTLSRSCGVQG